MEFKDWLNAKNVTLVSVAKKLDVSYSYLSDVKHKRKFPSKRLAQKLSNLTNGEVPPTDFANPNPKRVKCPTCGHVRQRE